MRYVVFPFISICIAVMLTACSPTKEDAIQEMVAPEPDTYNIYLFWDGEHSDLHDQIYELLEVINSEIILKSLKINNMTSISMRDENQKYDYKKLFNMEKSPHIIVLDHEGVVLETNDPEDIYTLVED